MKLVFALFLSMLLPAAALADEPPAPASGSAPTALADPRVLTPSAAAKRQKFHRIAGYTSSGLLLAGGTIGMAQWGSLAAAGHEYRDAHGGDGNDDDCSAYIQDLRNEPKHVALRGVHGGLVAIGELAYLSNAITGMRMRTQGYTPGKMHRIAFITHATLMLAEVGLGVGTTVALAQGDHDAQLALGGAHAVVGLTIPILMLGSGIAIDHATR